MSSIAPASTGMPYSEWIGRLNAGEVIGDIHICADFSGAHSASQCEQKRARIAASQRTRRMSLRNAQAQAATAREFKKDPTLAAVYDADTARVMAREFDQAARTLAADGEYCLAVLHCMDAATLLRDAYGL